MIKHLRINFICIAKSIFLKFISALIIIIVGMKLNLYTIPLDDAHFNAWIIVQLMFLYFIILSPLQYFITYILHDIKIQIYIDTKNNTLRIIDSQNEYIFQMSEVLKITKYYERRTKNNYTGYFYHKIETTKGAFYVSMFTTWNLSKNFPEIPYDEISQIFPFIKDTDILSASDDVD